MSGSNCCFLFWIQVSPKTDKVSWYSDLFKNFPQSFVIHTVKGSAAAAAKSLQSCPTLCDPIDGSPPGKNTGVGCHFLLQCMKVKSESEVAQLCPTLPDPMDCSLPGSFIDGIFQARVLEWDAIAFSILYTNNEKIAKQIKETIPFTIAMKRIEYLGINLPKETKDLYIGNFIVL